jgi:hypothetical protein
MMSPLAGSAMLPALSMVLPTARPLSHPFVFSGFCPS